MTVPERSRLPQPMLCKPLHKLKMQVLAPRKRPLVSLSRWKFLLSRKEKLLTLLNLLPAMKLEEPLANEGGRSD